MQHDHRDLVDHAASIQALAAAAGPFAEARERLLRATGVGPDDRLLELGCGSFPTVRALRRRVGARGRVVGVDAAYRFLLAARRRLRDAARTADGGRSIPDGSPGPGLVAADVRRLPFVEPDFDVVLADKLLVHLDAPRDALAEARRVLRRGGRFGAFEWDLPGLRVDSDDAAFVEVLAEVQLRTTASPHAPDEIGGWLREAGFAAVRVTETRIETRRLDRLWREFLRADLEAARRLELADTETLDRWWEKLLRRHRCGRFRATTRGVVATATRGG